MVTRIILSITDSFPNLYFSLIYSRDLIKAYRACTSRSEERALVKKEAAHIRDLFRQGDKHFRRQNVAKLLFFHMNGYPTDFGITECINLCASNKFADKRVAYLGLTILVNETESILMLMTNLLKQDLNSPDVQIVSLALNFLGDIGSAEMLRELMHEIETHMRSPNPLIRKKAGVVAVRAVRKLTTEDTVNVLNFTPSFFDTRSSAVHISGTALISALCAQDEANAATLQHTTLPIILSILEEHALGRPPQRTADLYGSAHEAGNPFLVAKLLSTARTLLSRFPPEVTILQHVARTVSAIVNRFNHSKVVGCAVLYECVRLTTVLRSQPEMRDMALIILGNFMDHKEATVRYVALKELTEFADLEGADALAGISGLEEKLLTGLKEADQTVRKQAVELVYRATNRTNIDQMLNELGAYVRRSERDDAEAIKEACEKMFLLADEYAPSDERKVETFITAASLGHRYISDEIITCLFAFVSARPSVRPYAVRALYERVLRPPFLRKLNGFQQEVDPVPDSDNESKPLVQRRPRCETVAIQVLGEYADVAFQSGIDGPKLVECFEYFATAGDDSGDVNGDPVVDEEQNQREFEIVGEAALSGLFKIAVRASGKSTTRIPQIVGNDNIGLTDLMIGFGEPSEAVPQLPPPPPVPQLPAPPSATDDLLALVPFGENVQENQVALYHEEELFGFDVPTSGSGSTGKHKLSDGVSTNEVANRVRNILSKFTTSKNVEQQQRACEYVALLDAGIDVAAQVAAPMPLMEYTSVRSVIEHAETRTAHEGRGISNEIGGPADLLVDIMDDDDSAIGRVPALTMGESRTEVIDSLHIDPLAALEALSLGDGPSSSVPGAGNLLALTMGEGDSVTGKDFHSSEFGSNVGLTSTRRPGDIPLKVPLENRHDNLETSNRKVVLLDAKDILIDLALESDLSDEAVTNGHVVISNKSAQPMLDCVLQLAVPRYMRLTMEPATASGADPGGEISQDVQLTNTTQGMKPIQLRYRVEFLLEGNDSPTQFEGVVSNLENR